MRFRSWALPLLVVLGAADLPAQLPLDSLVLRLAAMTAVSGYEQQVADSVRGLLPGATFDRAGDVVLTLGSGSPRALVACPLDEPGFVVGGIRPDGYLTIRRAGPSPGLLADQQYEGQRVTVFGRKGAVPGVVGVRSVHLTRGRSSTDNPFTFDDAYLDVGADSTSQIRRLGITLLSPVARTKAVQRYGPDLVAAPMAGRRAACAALIRAAREATPSSGSVVVALVVEQSFTRRGILTVTSTLGPFDQLLMVDAQGTRGLENYVDSTGTPRKAVMALPVKYLGTPVETVSLEDVSDLEAGLVRWIGGAR